MDKHCVIRVFLFFFVSSSGGAWSTAAGSGGDVSRLIECLGVAGLDNYTVPPVDPSGGGAASTSYYSLLSFSIQNLRFSPRPGIMLPAAVVLPSSQPDLRSAVLCCRAAGFGVRIRSGGHSYEGLSYTTAAASPFVVVDLMRLNRVRVDPASRTAWVEAGATLGETYHRIAAASGGSLGFSAGSCPTVGSGGHIAGGGFGLLSRKYGLAADNVLDAVLITADGWVMDREAMGEDVFWAIRGGGGGGWGAIYAWRIRLLPVPPRVAAFVVNRPGTSRVAELVHKWQLVAPSLPDEFFLSAFVGAGLPESTTRAGMSATFKGFYLGGKQEAAAITAEAFPELQLAEGEWQEMSWIESVVFFSGLPEGSKVSDLTKRVQSGRKSFKAKSDYVREPIPASDLRLELERLATEPKAYMILDPYGGEMARVSSDHLPFPHRGGNLYAIQYLIDWRPEEEEEEEHVEWLRGFYEQMAGSVSKAPRAAYVNYLDLDLGVNDGGGGQAAEDRAASARAWGERYFLGNYDRLVRAKTAVDPDDVFSNAQSIPPNSPNDKAALPFLREAVQSGEVKSLHALSL